MTTGGTPADPPTGPTYRSCWTISAPGRLTSSSSTQQAVKFGVELLMMREGVKSTFHDDRIWTDLADGGTMVARANVCATGVEWRRLNLPNEDKLLGRGPYYGAGASEAPLCDGEDVYVVGGGQAVMHLAKYARSVTMLVR